MVRWVGLVEQGVCAEGIRVGGVWAGGGRWVTICEVWVGVGRGWVTICSGRAGDEPGGVCAWEGQYVVNEALLPRPVFTSDEPHTRRMKQCLSQHLNLAPPRADSTACLPR